MFHSHFALLVYFLYFSRRYSPRDIKNGCMLMDCAYRNFSCDRVYAEDIHVKGVSKVQCQKNEIGSPIKIMAKVYFFFI